jgi:hypothetical protein
MVGCLLRVFQAAAVAHIGGDARGAKRVLPMCALMCSSLGAPLNHRVGLFWLIGLRLAGLGPAGAE